MHAYSYAIELLKRRRCSRRRSRCRPGCIIHQVPGELPCRWVLKDERARQRLPNMLLELVTQLDRPERVESSFEQRRIGVHGRFNVAIHDIEHRL